jgi:hypothetical protein
VANGHRRIRLTHSSLIGRAPDSRLPTKAPVSHKDGARRLRDRPAPFIKGRLASSNGNDLIYLGLTLKTRRLDERGRVANVHLRQRQAMTRVAKHSTTCEEKERDGSVGVAYFLQRTQRPAVQQTHLKRYLEAVSTSFQ